LDKSTFVSSGACLLLLCANTGNVQAQTSNQQVNQAVDQAGKTVQKDVKAVVHAGSKVAHKATAAAGRAARVTAATARKMFATPAWNNLSAAYDYNAAAPDVKENPVANDKAMEIKLSFTGPGGKPVSGVFLRPKGDGTYPCALVAHGLTQNKEAALSMFGNDLVAKGIAVLALDAPGHGANEPPNKKYWTKNVITIAIHEGDRNYRRALDYLATRPDVDMDHVGLLGYSMGAIMGSILGAVDDRITAFALCVGGDPFLPIAKATPDDKTRNSILQVCPSLFIGHIKSHPIIMFNGLTDVVVVPPAAKLLQAAAPQPKQVVWYNGGHDTPQAIRTRAVEWLANKLKEGADSTQPADKTGDDSQSDNQK
jgi:dienelactone hydrolase